ncbi:MAG: hypothetical protein JWR63_249 [Conexibacter sp.]|nr:hypothetical protein [Conexibacter sp.]
MSVSGPVEIVAIEFSGDGLAGDLGQRLADAVGSGAVRIIDLLFVERGEDGTVTSRELTEVDADTAPGLDALEGEVLGLVDDADLAAIGEALSPGASAALVVFEHVWARELVAGIRASGGRVALRHMVAADEVERALAALGIPAR